MRASRLLHRAVHRPPLPASFSLAASPFSSFSSPPVTTLTSPVISPTRKPRNLAVPTLNVSSSYSTNPDLDDLLIILDMDECLIHSQFLSGNEYRQYEDRSYAASAGDAKCEKFTLELPDGDIVVVNKRPGLDEFLEKVSQRWETHIFTAAMSVYASPVLDTLDPDDEIFAARYYRESCTVHNDLGVYVKDLSKIVDGRDLTRVVLVDNNPMSFLAQPSNGILVSNFYDDPADETLPAVLNLLEEIDGLKDVRPKLNKMFGLREALAGVLNKQRS